MSPLCVYKENFPIPSETFVFHLLPLYAIVTPGLAESFQSAFPNIAGSLSSEVVYIQKDNVKSSVSVKSKSPSPSSTVANSSIPLKSQLKPPTAREKCIKC